VAFPTPVQSVPTVSFTTASTPPPFSTLYTFTGASDGATPLATPILVAGSPTGTTYLVGTTYAGGANGLGSVYEVNIATDKETVVYSFLGQPADGLAPVAGVVLGPDGVLYGATYEGGSMNYGTVFKVTLAGVENVVHSFNGSPSEGADPAGTPIFDAAGNLYSTTYQGGADGFGTVYQITGATGTSPVLSTSTSFPTAAGSPRAGLTFAGGQYYGTTFGNSAQALAGTVYGYTAGVATPLYTFTGGADGAQPTGEVAADSDTEPKYLYGTTTGGGSGSFGDGDGVIFKVDIASGGETVLHTFGGSKATPPDGAVPMSGLTQDSSGNWYGTTSLGGVYNYGTVFELDASGTFTTLYSFTGGTDGAYPNAGVVLDSAGNIYGATSAGGAAAAPGGYGTVFMFTPATGSAAERKEAAKKK
jgi:uncharacterized repeat protein (TIGR03803 family)